MPSRRRKPRAHPPGPEGDASILPPQRARGRDGPDYGMDDLGWLLETSPVPGTIAIDRRTTRSCLLPVARFDSRIDRTSFLRDEPAIWPVAESLTTHHQELSVAFTALAAPEGTTR